MRHSSAIPAAAVGCALVLAACGSSSKPGRDSAGAPAPVKFSACMRAHGVPNFPDPGSGGGISISSGSGINPASPAFQDAQKKCGGGPGGGPVAGGFSESRKLAMLHLSQCMRRHGFTSFPDPTSGPPSAPPAGNGGGLAFGGPGGFISVPGSMLQSPGFQQAASACGFPEPGGHPPKGASLSPGPTKGG
jgi:hypothetical protein